MLSTREIVRGLSEQHFIEIRLEVQRSNYRKELIPILDKYRSGQYTELEVCEDSNLTENEYRLFEKRLYNFLIDFYRITPKLELDTVFSQAFHALYSKRYADEKEKSNDFENIFNKMQSLQMGEEGLELLFQLSELKKDTELHIVYHHLYNHYLNRSFANQRALVLINQFFNRVSPVSEKKPDQHDIRQLIVIYKQIRLLVNDADNPLTRIALRITQLALCVLFDQEQLLFQEKLLTQKLLVMCRNELKNLPGNFEKYYFNNIYLLIKLKWAKKNKDFISFSEIRERIKQDGKMLHANNFYFKIAESDLQYSPVKAISFKTTEQSIKAAVMPVANRFKLSENLQYGSEKRGTLYN